MYLAIMSALTDARMEIFADPARAIAVKHKSATWADLKIEVAYGRIEFMLPTRSRNACTVTADRDRH
jgi:hypothetical protein